MVEKFSQKGIFHIERETENQDAAVSSEKGSFTAIVLADGVSEFDRSGEGAACAAQAAAEYLTENGEAVFSYAPDTIIEEVAFIVKERLAVCAYENDCDVAELSSTLAFVLTDSASKKAVCFNLGDGMIISASETECRVVLQPEIVYGGCYVTTTEGFEKTIKCSIIDTSGINSISVCSDGAWRAMYRNTKMRPDIKSAFMRGDCGYIISFLVKTIGFDDRSIIWNTIV